MRSVYYPAVLLYFARSMLDYSQQTRHYAWSPFYFSITDDEDIFVVDTFNDRVLRMNAQMDDYHLVWNEDFQLMKPERIICRQNLLLVLGSDYNTDLLRSGRRLPDDNGKLTVSLIHLNSRRTEDTRTCRRIWPGTLSPTFESSLLSSSWNYLESSTR